MRVWEEADEPKDDNHFGRGNIDQFDLDDFKCFE